MVPAGGMLNVTRAFVLREKTVRQINKFGCAQSREVACVALNALRFCAEMECHKIDTFVFSCLSVLTFTKKNCQDGTISCSVALFHCPRRFIEF
jgi:hypothetical protein